jgi:hypothetical protein
MNAYNVVVTVHERREYLVHAPSLEDAKDNYSAFESTCDVTIIEETVEECEQI